ncbi:MAG: glycosyltransferase family 4 protein [Anaerolineae bacterium]|nr:glycosyltransferase family 4 protein [Anaerolineae bacterium]
MRIAFIHPPFETMPTISEQRATASLMVWTTQIARRLAPEHTVVIYSPGDATHQGTIHDQGIEYRYIDPKRHARERRIVNAMINLEYGANYPRRKRPIFATPWYFPRYINQIARELSAETWDVIHITHIPQYAPVIKRHNPGTKIAMEIQALWLSQFDPALVRGYLDATDLILTCADFVTNALVEALPEYADRARTLYNGIDIERFLLAHAERAPAPVDQPEVLFVGRISPEKGVHVLIEAFAQVAERYPQATLNIVGGTSAIGYHFLIPMEDDPIVRDLARFYHPLTKRDRYLAQLQAKIPPYLRERVHFRGSIPNQEVRDYLRRATVFAFPSVWQEPFGIALIEGMASGAPVVATRGGGPLEIIDDGLTGLLVERNDADALAQAMLNLIEQPALATQLGQAAQARIEHLFTWDQCADQLMDYYTTLLAVPAHARM